VLVDIEHRDAFAARAAELRRFVNLLHRDVEARAELLGRFDEALALDLHHEREHVAVLLAAKAMEEALVGHHVERRRLLAMERTQPFEGAARLLQLDVLADDRDDVRSRANLVDDFVSDHAYGCLLR